MIAGVDAVVLVDAVFAGLAVVAHEAGLALFERNAGYHADARAERADARKQLFDIALVIFLAVVHAGHERRFGYVRNDDVRAGAELGVLFDVVRVKGGIKLAVIRHDRIDEDDRAFAAEIGKKLFHHIYLLDRAEVSGVDRGEGQALVFPVLRDGRDLVTQVLAGEIFEHRVRGKHRRRQDHRFDAERRDDRQRDRKRAFPEAGDILHRQNFFHTVFPFAAEAAPSFFANALAI